MKKLNLKAIMRRLQNAKEDILAPVKEMIDWHERELVKLRRIFGTLQAAPNGATVRGKSKTANAPAATAPAKVTKRRKRRSPEQLTKVAQDALKVIKAKGKDGASAADLKRFGITGTVKKWFKDNLPDAKVRMVGAKASARYFAD